MRKPLPVSLLRSGAAVCALLPFSSCRSDVSVWLPFFEAIPAVSALHASYGASPPDAPTPVKPPEAALPLPPLLLRHPQPSASLTSAAPTSAARMSAAAAMPALMSSLTTMRRWRGTATPASSRAGKGTSTYCWKTLFL